MNTELKEYVDSLELAYTATFVPQSLSRNANDEHNSLNWRVTVGRYLPGAGPGSVHPARGVIGTDYMQGIGHIPESDADLFKRFGRSGSIARDAYEKSVAETGTYGAAFVAKKLPPPALLDVLYSLVLDSDADNETFEDWCSNYGYDTDSRKAEATYDQCRDIGTKLRRMLGSAALEKLRELFQDY